MSEHQSEKNEGKKLDFTRVNERTSSKIMQELEKEREKEQRERELQKKKEEKLNKLQKRKAKLLVQEKEAQEDLNKKMKKRRTHKLIEIGSHLQSFAGPHVTEKGKRYFETIDEGFETIKMLIDNWYDYAKLEKELEALKQNPSKNAEKSSFEEEFGRYVINEFKKRNIHDKKAQEKWLKAFFVQIDKKQQQTTKGGQDGQTQKKTEKENGEKESGTEKHRKDN
ncbi:hypothetical protein [Alkalibacillus aidingensis]|uniref:hypothetical protein n=1 Tax=Alkalibacillus aidingensis TaxID=2747607 RepID=UPI00166062BF|nr:hypothetical protein [Alkalibacillus aidingensis]